MINLEKEKIEIEKLKMEVCKLNAKAQAHILVGKELNKRAAKIVKESKQLFGIA